MADHPSRPERGVRAHDVRGIWRLERRVDTDASGTVHPDPVLGPDPLGMLCFSADHFAAQFMKRDRSGPSAAGTGTPGSNNSLAVDGYDAYFGTYRLDEASGALTVHLDASIAPANIGRDFVRNLRTDGTRLTISLETTSAGGTPVTRTLTFVRLP